jgi:hypothetical protein
MIEGNEEVVSVDDNVKTTISDADSSSSSGMETSPKPDN